METQSIVVLDFGSQYTQLIARRIREQNVFSVVLPCTASLKEIKRYAPGGIILSGGPSSVYDADAPVADEQVLHLGVPVLGICYGLHYMTHKLGGKVIPGDKREYGPLTSPSCVTTAPSSRVSADRCTSGCPTATRPKKCLRVFS